MRAWVKGSIAVLGLALVCAVMAPGAMAAPQPEETELVFLELTPRKDVQVWVEVHPQVGVAVVKTLMGISRDVVRRPRSGTIAYAVRIPKGPLEGRLDLEIPGVASIAGELLKGDKGRLEFNGSFHFTGSGGQLSFDADHATGGILKEGTRGCGGRACRAPHPSLFEYTGYPPELSLENAQVLYSEQSVGSRVTHFEATHYTDGPQATFQGQALEWLPGHVAVARTIEVEKAAGADFKVSSKSEHPKWARVRPPAPFSGSAVYRNSGTIRSPSTGKLTGPLSVDIYGVKVRLAGPGATASLFNVNPGF